MKIPSSVKVIGGEAFILCVKLLEVELYQPVGVDLCEGVEEIGVSAFEDCSSLKSVALPPEPEIKPHNVLNMGASTS